ncbi:MAG TPA: dTDP-glucose 4,6-dehydratase, partial [Spirochaetota bacterium]
RYAINCDKIKKELGWKQAYDFDSGLDATIAWYLEHTEWIARVQSGEYAKWIETNYSKRS